MDKQLQEYILDLQEINAYRTSEGVPFDFGTGIIENDLSYGTEEAIWEMEQQDIEEKIRWYNYDKEHSKRMKKYKLNRYTRKQINKIKLKQLSDYAYTVYYNGHKNRYVRFYLSGCRKYAKWCINRVVRNRNDFSPKGSGYRKTFDYCWTVF